MNQRIIFVLLIFLSVNMASNAQVSLTATSGTTSGTYSTLGAAFVNINNGTHQGVITISLSGSTNETSSAVLNASGSGSASYTSVSIYPTLVGLSITGNIANIPLIDLNGADNVTIDGRINATGSTISLVISNTSTNPNSTSTIRFTNDATNNTIQYCKIQGSGSNTSTGILLFSTTTVTAGNSNNLIDHNEITCAGSNRPFNAIYSYGSSTASNVSNTVSNNNFHDFLWNSGGGNNSCGIMLANSTTSDGYNSAWTITGNSFYETSSLVPGSGTAYYIIYIGSRAGSIYGDNFTISNNFIGGNGPGCTGTFIKTNASTNYFYGIVLHVGTGNPSNIQGNTIKNIRYYNNGTADWWGIYIDYGAANIGSTSGNYIGSASDTGSIFYSCGGSGSRFLAMHLQGDGTCYIQNNVIGSITTANTNSANSTNFWGFHQQSRYNNNIITSNTIGSNTVANSIKALSPSTSSAQTVIGYSGDGNGGNITFSNNTVANLTNGTTNTTAATMGEIYGVWAFTDQYTITGNTVHDLTIANANTGTGPLSSNPNGTSLSAGGILVAVNSNTSHTISGNTVYNISNTYSSFAGNVAGIYFYGSSGTNVSTIDKNFVYGLSVSSGSTSASIYGIDIAEGSATCSNNIITLGGNTTTRLYGIYESGGPNSYSNSVYFNTVYLGGSPASGSVNSYCLYSALNSNTRNIRNNILDNARSNNGTHYAMYFAYTGGNLTCDFNDYYVSGTGGKLGYYGGG